MVALPIRTSSDDSHVVRLYQRAITLWSSHVADEAAFGPAAVYANAKLRTVPEANCVIGDLPADQVDPVLQYFAQASTSPLQWLLPGGDGQLAGLTARSLQLWQLSSPPANLPLTHPDLTIIPARASFPHVREVAAQMRPALDPADTAEAAMSHLDDAHLDAILALSGGRPAGYASILSIGEVGFVMELFVPEPQRRRGYGLALGGQILDIAARSLFRQVYCVTDITGGNPGPVSRFLGRIGFAPDITLDCRAKA